MLVELQPHVEQNVCRHARVTETAHDVENEAEDAQCREPEDDALKRPEVATDEGRVDEVFRQIGDGECGRGADEADDQDEREPVPVGPEIGKRTAELGVRLLRSGGTEVRSPKCEVRPKCRVC